MLDATEVLIFVGVFAASAGFIGWWKDKKRSKGNQSPPPAFPSLPFIGSLPYVRGLNNVPEFFLKASDQLGPIFTFMAGPIKIIVLNSKDVIEDAYINHLSVFSGRRHVYIDALENSGKKGISFRSTDAEWKRLHRLSLSILKEFGFGVKNQMEERILKEVEAMVDYVRTKSGQTFTPRDTIAMVATNIINNIVFGYRQEYAKGLGDIYVQAERSVQGLDITFDLSPAIRFLPRFRDKVRIYRESQRQMANLFRQEISRCRGSAAEDCFIKRYLEKEGNKLDEDQLVWTLRDLVAAGSDTTTATILWSLVALANDQGIQDRLRKEIDAVVPRSRLPTMDDQCNLPYAEANVLELMRWKTLIPLSLPRITLNDTNVMGYSIAKGSMILANLYAVHMDPKVWVNPSEFQPQRFLDNDSNVTGRDRIIPFSLGRRSCLGEVLARSEIFLVVTALVQNFIILPPEGQVKVDVKPMEPIGLVMIPLPFDIRLIPRQ